MNSHRSSSSPSLVETAETSSSNCLKGGERRAPMEPRRAPDKNRDLHLSENSTRPMAMTTNEGEKIDDGAGRSLQPDSGKTGAPEAAWFGKPLGVFGKVDAGEGHALSNIRQTEEYRAAWDLELWKAIQAERFRRQLEQQRARALKSLAQAVKLKEAEAEAAMERRAEALNAREASLAKEAAALKRRESRLRESARALARMRQQLLDAQQRVAEEARAHGRRAHEAVHRAELLQERVRAAELQAQRAEERQRQAQADALRLYAELRRPRGEPPVPAGEGGAPLAGVDPAPAEGLLCESLEARYRAALAEVTGRCRELEGHNVRLAAALARRREQLRARRGKGERGPKGSPSPSPAEVALGRELGRLVEERVALLEGSAGAIDSQNPVVLRLDARLSEIRQQLERAQRCEE